MSLPNVSLGSLDGGKGNFVDGPFGSNLKASEYTESGVPIMRLQNIRPNAYIAKNVKFISEQKSKSLCRHNYKAGDVLIAKLGAVGTACIVPDTCEDGIIVADVVRFRGDKSRIDYLYLCHFLNSVEGQKRVLQFSKGTTRLRTNLSDLKKVEIPLPPLNDQKRIAHLLGKVEGLIARRKQHLEQLDDLFKSVFLEMFGDPVRNDKGWDTVSFHKVGKFISGGTPSKKREDFWIGNFPWVSPKDMKVTKIGDSKDHISEKVFKETSLKRIAPNHLLIVVRGMILAHSFPVAINSVEIAINQDMKAIKPYKEINVVFLLHCLISMKRQILKLISTAGHGTRKLDSIAMEKLLIPKPPKDLQEQFISIAGKVESIKSRYQQSLAYLESLYGALSQKAFKGELDLSRVPLPTERPDITKEAEVVDTQPLEPLFELPAPADLALLSSPEGRKAQLDQWLTTWLEQLGDAPFAAQPFMEAAQQRLWELVEEEIPDWGADEYDELKALLFEALKEDRLTQSYDDANNRVQITAAKG